MQLLRKFYKFSKIKKKSSSKKIDPKESTDIINIIITPPFPPFTLPELPMTYSCVLKKPQSHFCAGLQVDVAMATALEANMRCQHNGKPDTMLGHAGSPLVRSNWYVVDARTMMA